MSDVPERLLDLAWKSAEEWSRQSPDNPRPLSIRDMVIIRVGVSTVLADLVRQATALPHGDITDGNGRPRPCPMEWPGGPCECYRANVLDLIQTGGSDEG